jgi:hypothetical protein
MLSPVLAQALALAFFLPASTSQTLSFSQAAAPQAAARSSGAQEQRGFLGVSLDGTDGPPVIQSLVPGGPAARAGLRPGDRILTIDEQEVRSSEELARRIRAQAPGSPVRLGIEREGVRQNVLVALGVLGEPDPQAGPRPGEEAILRDAIRERRIHAVPPPPPAPSLPGQRPGEDRPLRLRFAPEGGAAPPPPRPPSAREGEIELELELESCCPCCPPGCCAWTQGDATPRVWRLLGPGGPPEVEGRAPGLQRRLILSPQLEIERVERLGRRRVVEDLRRELRPARPGELGELRHELEQLREEMGELRRTLRRLQAERRD